MREASICLLPKEISNKTHLPPVFTDLLYSHMRRVRDKDSTNSSKNTRQHHRPLTWSIDLLEKPASAMVVVEPADAVLVSQKERCKPDAGEQDPLLPAMGWEAAVWIALVAMNAVEAMLYPNCAHSDEYDDESLRSCSWEKNAREQPTLVARRKRHNLSSVRAAAGMQRIAFEARVIVVVGDGVVCWNPLELSVLFEMWCKITEKIKAETRCAVLDLLMNSVVYEREREVMWWMHQNFLEHSRSNYKPRACGHFWNYVLE